MFCKSTQRAFFTLLYNIFLRVLWLTLLYRLHPFCEEPNKSVREKVRLSSAADSMESCVTHDRRICFRKEKTMKNSRLERLNQEHRTAEIRLTLEKHREKQ